MDKLVVAFILLVVGYSFAGAESADLVSLRGKACEYNKVYGEQKTCFKNPPKEQKIVEIYEGLCKLEHGNRKIESCRKMIDSSVEKDKSFPVENYKSCRTKDACVHSQNKGQMLSCLWGLGKGAANVVMAVVGLPEKLFQMQLFTESKACFENKDGAKQRLFDTYDSSIVKGFEKHKIPLEIRTQAINTWSCEEINRYLENKKQAYKKELGPLVAQGKIAPENGDSDAVKIAKVLQNYYNEKWTCMTDEAQAELACEVAATLAIPFGASRLVAKLGKFGFSETEAMQLTKVINKDDKSLFDRGRSDSPESPKNISSTEGSTPSSSQAPAATNTAAAVMKETSSVESTTANSTTEVGRIYSKAERAVMKRFDHAHDEGFQKKLHEFRGTKDNHFDTQLHGSEGQLYLSPTRPRQALKRFFKDNEADHWQGVKSLEEVAKKVESTPKVSSNLSVIKIYEKGPDWIIREFDPTSIPLKKAVEFGRPHQAWLDLIKELKASKDPLMKKILKKLERKPISENLHWSPSKNKILLIDFARLVPAEILNSDTVIKLA